ncbi:MarR family transcriptional regulator [Streptomyces sp. NPDC058678]|uniref:MarR family transcriptional regulator n=1 Tax=Streptomyces sp. NPDC058678 TaxID=3346595 RepID=UPI003661EB76
MLPLAACQGLVAQDLRISDLAQALSWSQSRLSHAVARMEKAGWIRRPPPPPTSAATGQADRCRPPETGRSRSPPCGRRTSPRHRRTPTRATRPTDAGRRDHRRPRGLPSARPCPSNAPGVRAVGPARQPRKAAAAGSYSRE